MFNLVFHKNTHLIKKYLGESHKFKTSLTCHKQSCVETAQPSLGKHAADWWEETQACSGKGVGGCKLAVRLGCQLSRFAERVCGVSPEGKSNSNTVVDNRIVEVDSKPRENCRDAEDETRNLRTHKDEMV